MLTDIKGSLGSNPGGNCELNFSPLGHIKNFPTVTDLVVAGDPLFWTDKRWLNIETIQNKASFDEDEAEDANGPVYTISIKALVRGDSPAIKSQLRKMVEIRHHIVKCRDAAGLTRLVGSANQQLRFRYKLSLGDSIGGLRCYSIEFYGVFTQPAALFA